MKFLRLRLQNFLTIGEAEIDLADRGLILIQGDNEADSSASSNGAGKSSIVDGLCWLNFGVTARGVTGDAVINRTAKKECVVAAYIEDGGVIYRVARHRKHSTNKNALLIDKVDATGAVLSSLTKGTDKETQEVLTTILGCSYEVFTSSIYAGQEKMPDLPAMTDKSLKVLIEEAAGVEVLEEAHTIAKARLNAEKTKLNDVAHQVASNKSLIELTNTHLENEKAKQKNFDETKRDRVKSKLAGVLEEQKEIKAAEAYKAKFDKTKLVGRKEQLVELVKHANEINAEAQKKRDEWNHAQYRAELAENNYTNKANEVRRYVGEIKSIDGLVGTGCKECGKTICSHDVEDARKAKRATAESLAATAKSLKAEHGEAVAKAERLKLEANEATAKIVNVVELTDEIRKIDNMLNALEGVETKISMHNANIDGIKRQANEMLTEANPFTETVTRLTAQLGTLKGEAEKLEDEATRIGYSVELHTAACGVYGAGGVRAHILDTVTPFLNDRTRDYLGALADGNIHATWTTLTKNAKGELKEKFSIAVTNDTGSDSFAGLSGGEKRKVRLATAMALQDLVSSRASKPIELFIGDEIDDALDGAGLERLMTVLERKARERGTVLVISHNDLKDSIDQTITVHKKGGQSYVSGDTTK